MKLELNVVRMTNEDVIATSACSHIGQETFTGASISASHIKVNGDYFSCYVDSNQNGQLESGSTYPLMMFASYNSFSTINGNGWYFYDANIDRFVKCDSQSDEAHTVEGN